MTVPWSFCVSHIWPVECGKEQKKKKVFLWKSKYYQNVLVIIHVELPTTFQKTKKRWKSPFMPQVRLQDVKGWTKEDHLSWKTNTYSPSCPVLSLCRHPNINDLLHSRLSLHLMHVASLQENVSPVRKWSLTTSFHLNCFLKKQPQCFPNVSFWGETNLRLTLDPLFVTAFAMCRVWRTFSLNCSDSLTRLAVPGYPISPWLTGLSSLALANQFTPVALRHRLCCPTPACWQKTCTAMPGIRIQCHLTRTLLILCVYSDKQTKNETNVSKY